MGWKERFTFRERHCVTHEINGEKLRFFPNRVGLLHDLAELSKPAAKAVAVLLGDRQDDRGASDKKMTEGSTEIHEYTVQGASPEVLKLRAAERDAAIDALIDSLSDPRGRILIGRLLMDSLRDEFEHRLPRPTDEVETFLNGDGKDYPGLDLPTLAQMIHGWILANSKVFGVVGEQIAAAARERLGGLRSASPSATPSPSSGSDSKTPSSPPSSPASLSIA